MDEENVMSYEQRMEKFNRFINNYVTSYDEEYIQKNKNQQFHRSSIDKLLNDKQVYNVKVTKCGNYIDERVYHGNMVKSVFTKEERIRLAYKSLTSLFGKDVVTIEDAERYVQDNSNTRSYSEKGSVNDKILNKNYYRTYLILRNYALANSHSFRSFITLTFAKNVETSEEANNAFQIWVKMIQRLYPDFKYLGVPERQKRGAIHYHLLTSLLPDCDIIPRRPRKKVYNRKTKTYVELDYYDLKYWSHGFSTAFDLDMTDENFSVVSYLAKYFWKEKDHSFFGKKKVFHSHNLIKYEENFYYDNTEAFERYKQSLMDAVLIKSTMIEAKTDYCPNVEINEYKKSLIDKT